LVKHLIS